MMPDNGGKMRPLHLVDFDWKLKMGVSSSEMLQLRKPILRLTLTLERSGPLDGDDARGMAEGARTAAVEMDETAMDETIKALEALRAEMRAADAAVAGIK